MTRAPEASPDLKIATWNLRALMRPGYTPWPDQAPYSKREYKAKLDFLEARLRHLGAQVVGVQEVAQAEALDDLRERLDDLYPHHVVGERGSGSGLRVGVLSRYPVQHVGSHVEFAPEGLLRLEPGGAPISDRFRRPVLAVRLDVAGSPLTLVNVHLKAKRPDYFPDEEPRGGDPGPVVPRSRAMGRSLVARAAESVGLRALLGELQVQSKGAVVLVGDFNDGPASVTTQILGKRPPGGGGALETDEFYSTLEMARKLQPDLRVYTHIWEGAHEVLDHIVVSGDLAARFQELRCYNDHLADAPKDPALTDHGALVARFTWPGLEPAT